MYKKWLVTGASGFLGTSLCQHLKKDNNNLIVGLNNSHPLTVTGVKPVTLELTNKILLNKLLLDEQPDVVLHCAAMTNVDQCETQPDLAMRVNAIVCKNLADTCASIKAKLVMISTDQLWDNADPWIKEDTPPTPANVYGESKALGERYVSEDDNSLVLRTNFFGRGTPWNNNLINQVIETLTKKRVFRVFVDVYFSPLDIELLSVLIIESVNQNLSGIYHMAGSERLSKYEFALRVAERFNLNTELLEKASVLDVDFKAKRPAEMSLSTEKLANSLHMKLPDLTTSLDSSWQSYQS